MVIRHPLKAFHRLKVFSLNSLCIMCRFTFDQCSIECLSANIVSNKESLRVRTNKRKVLRVLPTIDELQEDGGNKDDRKLETPSNFCSPIRNLEKLLQTNKGSRDDWLYGKTTKSDKLTRNKQRNCASDFHGFGDFFPQDFASEFSDTAGIKKYLEKQQLEFDKVSCREQQLKVMHKNQGPEVQSWLHFFG